MQCSRRSFLHSAVALGALRGRTAAAQVSQARIAETPVLNIGYEESGNPQGFPIILLHGFPDDIHAWDNVVPALAQANHRVLVPYLRGCGPTRFRDPGAPRMAEQAAIGQDLIDFADALKLPRFVVAGYDWGGRAAGVTSVLHPERVRAAVLIGGYTVQNVFTAQQPASPEAESRIWYQWYFNTERGRAGLKANRRALCKLLWQEWSPTWHFSEETFERTAPSFDNPDFVDCVIHSYRHRLGNAPGEPRFEATEHKLAERLRSEVPTVVLYGADDALGRVPATATASELALFKTLVARRIVAGSGHFMPREKPDAVAVAILEVMAGSR